MDSLKLAQGLRGWQQKHPALDLAAGFVPLAGQAYGLASSAAAMRDPEASNLEKGMAVASILPVGKAAGALKKIVVGEKASQNMPSLAASLKRAKERLREISLPVGAVSKGPRGITKYHKGDPRINDDLVKETGWWQDPETGKWMNELDDSRSSPDWDMINQSLANEGGRKSVLLNVEDTLQHPTLTKAYPDMKPGYGLSTNPGLLNKVDPNMHVGEGSYRNVRAAANNGDLGENFEQGAARMNDWDEMGTFRDSQIHEVQHAIAQREGYSLGTNSTAAGGFEDYLKDPGERLARLAALRRNMTPDARRKYTFNRHMDDEMGRLNTPGEERRYATNEDLKRALRLRNLDPDEMLVPAP